MDAAFQVSFQDFCKAAARLGFAVDARGLFSIDDDDKFLTLEELSPSMGKLMNMFIEWGKTTFGGPSKMLTEIDKGGGGRLTQETFMTGCRSFGFEAANDEFAELFSFCDVHDAKSIMMEDVLIFEANPAARQLEAFKLRTRMSDKDQRQRILATVYTEEKRCSLPATHRLAPRPWLAPHFDCLPTVVCQRRGDWRHTAVRKAMHARIVFLRHLRGTFGNEVRAWRCGLDVEERFSISQSALRCYCRKVNLNVDMVALWKSLDKDQDFDFEFYELCPQAANVLAKFQTWSKERAGSCAAIWDLPEALAARCRQNRNGTWASDKKMLFGAFAQTLKALGWKPIHDPRTRHLLLMSLDNYGIGVVSQRDLEWVDKFDPPQWLSAHADEDEWQALRELMLEKFSHPLRTWRVLLDKDDSNHISWAEFRVACEKLQFEGDAAAAWRCLDLDISGTITLKEFDADSHELLTSFKEWCDQNFGSVALTFKALDTDGSNTLSYGELKRACFKYNWHGEVRLLFDCLDIDGKKDPKMSGFESAGKRSISAEELAFLDSWPMEPTQEQRTEDEAICSSTPVHLRASESFSRQFDKMHSITSMSTSTSDDPLDAFPVVPKRGFSRPSTSSGFFVHADAARLGSKNPAKPRSSPGRMRRRPATSEGKGVQYHQLSDVRDQARSFTYGAKRRSKYVDLAPSAMSQDCPPAASDLHEDVCSPPRSVLSKDIKSPPRSAMSIGAVSAPHNKKLEQQSSREVDRSLKIGRHGGSADAADCTSDAEQQKRLQQIDAFLESEEKFLAKSARMRRTQSMQRVQSMPAMDLAAGGRASPQRKQMFD